MGITLYHSNACACRELREMAWADLRRRMAKRNLCGAARAGKRRARTNLAFIGNRKAARQAATPAAGCLIVPLEFPNAGGRTLIRAAEPRTAFARAVAGSIRRAPRSCPASTPRR